jgi:hypothetical protein
VPRYLMDDAFHSDPAVLRAGTAAFGLYARCGDYVAQHLLDGIVPSEIAALYGTREWAEKLTGAGLWEIVDGGYYMPHYFRHGNPTADKVLAARKAKAARQQRWLDKQPPRRASRSSTRPSKDASQDASADIAPTPSLTGRTRAPGRARDKPAGQQPPLVAVLGDGHPFIPDADGNCTSCSLPESNRHHQPGKRARRA